MVYTIQTAQRWPALSWNSGMCAVYIATIKKTTPPNSGRIERAEQTLVMMDTDGGGGAGSGTGGVVVQLDSGLDDMSLADGRIFLA